jgi:hypothetical protein
MRIGRWIGCLLLLGAAAWAQAAAPDALSLYRDLRTVGLDAERVFQVRDVTLDRGSLHLSLNDGTIAFTRAVNGRVTGAFFEGDGEVLVAPPTLVERASLTRFTGAAILEERFNTAYLRFNDDTAQEIRTGTRAQSEAALFVSQWDGAAKTLADVDALRLLATMLATRSGDRMLHARLGSVKFGAFDVTYDSLSPETVTVAQVAHVENGTFYDVWTSFSPQGLPTEEQAQRELRISRYHVRAHIEPPHDLQADTELTMDVGSGGARMVVMELSRYLKVTSITMRQGAGEVPLQFLQNEALEGSQLSRRGNDLIALIFPEPLKAHASVQLRFQYSGPVMTEAGGGLMYVGARGTWYPNRGPEMAEFDLEFRSPPNWVLLATGKRTQNETKDGEAISRWVSEHPVPLAGFNLGQYDRATAKAGNVVVAAYATRGVENTFPTAHQQALPIIPNPPVGAARREPMMVDTMPVPPPDPAAHAQHVAELSARTIDWLSKRLTPFPFSSLEITQMPGTVSQGWPGLVFMSSYVFMADEERMERHLTPYNQLLYSKVVPAHETIHQWWGDQVLWRSYRDQWLMEAMSNYLALMDLQRDKPDAAKSLLEHYREDLLRKNREGDPIGDAGPVSLGPRLVSSKFPDAHEIVMYGRGTWLIHMLREMLRDTAPAAGTRAGRRGDARDSDELFFTALRTLLEQNRYKRVGFSDLQKALEAVLPASAQFEGSRSLDWFLEGWVNGTAVPHLELSDVKIALRGGHNVASGKILQSEAPKLLVTSIPIYAVVAGKQQPLGRIFADGEETAFHLNVPPGTTKLLLDPNGTVLSQ